MGPTACGKTDLAIKLYERLPMDIVSVDSAMVYRGMDIGTAKPDPATLAHAPHRLIDVVEPTEVYSAARFREDATREIGRIHDAGRIPLLVGGTMLYFAALYRGLTDLPPAAPAVRECLAAEAAEHGWPFLHRRLAQRDPVSAERIHPNDGQRIQRALEILEITGRPRTLWYRDGHPLASPRWPLLRLALLPEDRGVLHARIGERFRAMMEAGFLEEVVGLRARPDLDADTPAMRAVGYRQLWCHLEGIWRLETAVERGIIATRQLAKRQMTWLRREPEAAAFPAGDRNLMSKVLNKLVNAGIKT